MNAVKERTLSGHVFLQRPVVDPENSKGTLVILHGYGADEHDLMGLASYFDKNIQILSVRGPGKVMYGGSSWFDIDIRNDGSLIFNVEQALENTSKLIYFIQELLKQGVIKEDKVILGGFSQGATISQLVTLMRPDLIKALLIMSGRLTEQALGLLKDSASLSELPVFAGHGIKDDVIPIEYGRRIVAFWENLPVNIEHYEYPMGHEICQEELHHIQQWIKKN